MHRLSPGEILKMWWAKHPAIPIFVVLIVVVAAFACAGAIPTGPTVMLTGRAAGYVFTSTRSGYDRSLAVDLESGRVLVMPPYGRPCQVGDLVDLRRQPHLLRTSYYPIACRPPAWSGELPLGQLPG